MDRTTDDVRVESLRPLIPPVILVEEIPLTTTAEKTVKSGRDAIHSVLNGDNDRLICVVGPCSVHDPIAAREYANRLNQLRRIVADDLIIVMRTYFEKPRTTIGWKGLINDPNLDESFEVNRGLRIARNLLRDVADLGLPTGTEFLDPITPQYVADLVSWGAVGARTTESQVHREMASGLSMPVGFKNATSGDIQIALDAVKSSKHRHRFLGVTKQGLSAIVATRGNPDCHIILRGGRDKPNYDATSIADAAKRLQQADISVRVMIDCSHDNSRKDHTQQAIVAADVAGQVAAGDDVICGVMLESFLIGGKQQTAAEPLTYGMSITDACMSWETTEDVLRRLAAAVRQRRTKAQGRSES